MPAHRRPPVDQSRNTGYGRAPPRCNANATANGIMPGRPRSDLIANALIVLVLAAVVYVLARLLDFTRDAIDPWMPAFAAGFAVAAVLAFSLLCCARPIQVIHNA